jgi:hypothetical protein
MGHAAIIPRGVGNRTIAAVERTGVVGIALK